MIRATSSGNFSKTTGFLNRLLHGDLYTDLDRYGQMGVEALARATPVRTGLAADSWGYRVIRGKSPAIEWYNTDQENGASVIILIQYGHGTGTGGYVEGRDIINPAMRSVFDQISEDIWRKVVTER
jgi:hypothetical protein